MIYKINDKYYIRISPLKYKEIEMELIDDDVKVVAKQNTLEATGSMIITPIDFQSEKSKFKEQLLQTQSEEEIEESNEDVINYTETRRYRRRG